MAPDRDDAAPATDPSTSSPEAPTASTRASNPQPQPPSSVAKQAREALATGRVWLARDVLAEQVETVRDPEALTLLGEVLHRMGDLPAAGAMWFGTSARGAAVDESITAWRAAHEDDFGAMWDSLPAPVQQLPRSAKVEALRLKAGVPDEAEAMGESEDVNGVVAVDDVTEAKDGDYLDEVEAGNYLDEVDDSDEVDGRHPSRPTLGGKPKPPRGIPAAVSRVGGLDGAQVIAWILAALVAICTVVGLITILRWIVPG